MAVQGKNRNLHEAKRNKKDEFYTQLVDIEKELRHYRNHFKGKVVYCNCDGCLQTGQSSLRGSLASSIASKNDGGRVEK